MTPTIGRIVHYTLGESDVAEIDRRRQDCRHAGSAQMHTGYQGHVGNDVHVGEVVPAMIVYVIQGDPPSINGQAFLDGNDTLWVTSRMESEEPKPGCWHWPPRV